VSCQGTRILEQTMQVARHIRCIVLRSSTEVARSCRRSAVARFMQYGDCIRLLLPRLERTPLPAARQWRYEASAPRSTSCLTRHTSASPDKCCQLRAVAQRLSTILAVRGMGRHSWGRTHALGQPAGCGRMAAVIVGLNRPARSLPIVCAGRGDVRLPQWPPRERCKSAGMLARGEDAWGTMKSC